jgi:phenylalanyl-tRNA synthetase beta chain
MVIDESVRVGEVVAAVRKVAGPLAESVELFDVYTGKQIARGRKSVAIAISFRSEKGSLSNEEVDELQGNIVSSLKRDFNADIRDR